MHLLNWRQVLFSENRYVLWSWQSQVCGLDAFHQEREVILQMACDTFNNNMVAQFAVCELLTSTDTNQNAD